MRNLLLACLLFVPAAAHAAYSSVGVVGGIPDLGGIYASTFVAPDTSINLRIEATVLDAASAYHVPVGNGLDVLAEASFGWRHNLLGPHAGNSWGPHGGAVLGLGFWRTVDVRILAGIDVDWHGNRWNVGPAVRAMVGKTF